MKKNYNYAWIICFMLILTPIPFLVLFNYRRVTKVELKN